MPMRLALRLLPFAFALVCETTHAQILSPSGYGEVRFGERIEVIEKHLKQLSSPREREVACSFVRFTKYPGIQFMVEDGVITRGDADHQLANTAGVRLGMTLSQVKKRAPTVKLEPHKYDPTGHYLLLSTSDGKAALMFEAANGRVTDIRAGLQPAVSYVERCL